MCLSTKLKINNINNLNVIFNYLFLRLKIILVN